LLFAGDDWAEDHHDVEVQDGSGRVLGRARLPEGVAGIGRFHELIGRFADPDAGPDQVVIGIETDRGPWVAALIAAGYVVYAVNPRQAARYRERQSTSGAKSDAGDAHMLADMVRTDSHQLRGVAGDSGQAQAVKVVARAHQALIWERTRHVLRLRSALREFFPGALDAFDDLAAPDALELLARAADPASAARLSIAQITAALKRARRRNTAEKAARIQAALRGQQLAQPQVVAAAYAATVRAAAAVISVLNEQVTVMEAQVESHFGEHPDAEILVSQPGLGWSSVPGCSPSSGTTRTATPTPAHAMRCPEPSGQSIL
jgi:transposase